MNPNGYRGDATAGTAEELLFLRKQGPIPTDLEWKASEPSLSAAVGAVHRARQERARPAIQGDPMKRAIKAILRRIFGPLFFALVVAFAFTACGQGTQSPPPLLAAPNQPQCAAGNGGVLICIDGNGNVITINPAPTPTPQPAPTPGSLACNKGIPIYQEIVVQAEDGIPANQSQASYMAALVAKLKDAGFLLATGGLLPSDEIALKTSTTATFSETYDVWRADNTPQVLYQETCTPARF